MIAEQERRWWALLQTPASKSPRAQVLALTAANGLYSIAMMRGDGSAARVLEALEVYAHGLTCPEVRSMFMELHALCVELESNPDAKQELSQGISELQRQWQS